MNCTGALEIKIDSIMISTWTKLGLSFLIKIEQSLS